MNTNKKIIHLLSGGLDSVVLLYDLIDQGCHVHCILFDYKQRHVQELIWAKHHCHRLNVLYTTIEVPQIGGSALTDGKGGDVVAGRNLTFISLAAPRAIAAGAESITYGPNAEDEANFPDCRMAFVQTVNNLLTIMELPVEVCAPYIHKSKAWIAARGRDLGVNFNETWSCYAGGIQPCGKCAACKKRESALA